MYSHLQRALLTMALLCCAGACAAPAQPLAVDVPPADLSTSPAPLKAFLFEPAGPGPFPGVVMLHGCGGPYAKGGQLNARHQIWGEYLAAHGYVALMLDSFTSRGLKEICTVKYRSRPIKESERVGDAYAALAWLAARPDVAADRVALLGWSHGAGVTLDAITHHPAQAPAFRAAVAFYPGCTARAKTADRFHPYAPLFILIGEADDWTPAAPCKALASSVAARGEPMRIVTFPDTYHDFDNPALKSLHVRKEVPNGAHPGQGVTVAPNSAAREEAMKDVLDYFAQNVK